MKVYTGQGDEGFTYRPGGKRVRKSHPCCDAVGEFDELNAALGWCVCAAGSAGHDEMATLLRRVQAELLTAGTMLAAAGTSAEPEVVLDASATARLEAEIDRRWAQMPEQAQFVIPGGCELACRLHLARTICRRLERSAVLASGSETRIPRVIFPYVNRVSDLLFCLAREANHRAGVADTPWPGADGA